MPSVDAARCIQFARSVAWNVKHSNAPWQGSLLSIAFVANTSPLPASAAGSLIALLVHRLVKPYTFLEIYEHQQSLHARVKGLRVCMICVLGKARLPMGWAEGDRIPEGVRFSSSVHIRPWGPCSLPYRSGSGPIQQPPIQSEPCFFPGGKAAGTRFRPPTTT